MQRINEEIVKFVIDYKKRHCSVDCRKLAKIVASQYAHPISKSSISNILKVHKLNSPVGRRPLTRLEPEVVLEHGGFYLLYGIDELLGISKAVSEVIARVDVRVGVKKDDVWRAVKSLLMHQVIFDTTTSISACYRNNELWNFIGRRPQKRLIKPITKMINNHQLYVNKAVTLLKEQLRLTSGFRFVRADQSRSFVDASRNTIHNPQIIPGRSSVTHYESSRYVEKFLDKKGIFRVDNAPEGSLDSFELLSFVIGMNAEDPLRRLDSIELLDCDGELIDRRILFGTPRRYFMIGVWPWQLQQMYEFESRAATESFINEETGERIYAQVEETFISQPIDMKHIMMNVIVLRGFQNGPAFRGILTNIAKEKIHNLLKYNELYTWVSSLSARTSAQNRGRNVVDLSAHQWNPIPQLDELANNHSTFSDLLVCASKIVYDYFTCNIVPPRIQSWSRPKIKDEILRKKAKIIRSRKGNICKLLYSNELRNKQIFLEIFRRLNQIEIYDEEDRQFLFTFDRHFPTK